MPGVHRDTDCRDCGASNVVVGQDSVFVNSLKFSVQGDPNDHGDGALIASGSTVYAGGILIIVKGDSAAPDALCPIAGGAHCTPKALCCSSDVNAYGS